MPKDLGGGWVLDDAPVAATPATQGKDLGGGWKLDDDESTGEPESSSLLGSVGSYLKGAVVNPIVGAVGMAKRVAAGPQTTGERIAYGVAGPLGPLAMDIAKTHLDTGKKAVQSAREGDYTSAAGYGLATALPGVGPAAAAIGEKIGEGKVAEGLGEATALIAGPRATKTVGKVGKSTVQAVRGAFEADPAIALVKALKPTPSDSGFTTRLPDTVGHIKAAGGSVANNEQLIIAAKAAKVHHQKALEAWMDPARQMGVKVTGDPIAQATASAIPEAMRLEDPGAAQAIAAQAQKAYGGRSFTVDQLRVLLKEKNAELKAFYDRAQGKQAAAVTSGSPEAVVKAQRDTIAEQLYQALDPENNGAGPRQIQQQTGDIIDILEAAERRRNAIIGEKPVSKAGAAGKTVAGLLDLPGKVLHGDVEGGVQGVIHGASGVSDPLIARAFKAAGKPAPLPMPPPRPRIAGLLGPGPIVTPPPMDPSFVKGVTGPPLPLPRTNPAGIQAPAPMRPQPPVQPLGDISPGRVDLGPDPFNPRPRLPGPGGRATAPPRMPPQPLGERAPGQVDLGPDPMNPRRVEPAPVRQVPQARPPMPPWMRNQEPARPPQRMTVEQLSAALPAATSVTDAGNAIAVVLGDGKRLMLPKTGGAINVTASMARLLGLRETL